MTLLDLSACTLILKSVVRSELLYYCQVFLLTNSAILSESSQPSAPFMVFVAFNRFNSSMHISLWWHLRLESLNHYVMLITLNWLHFSEIMGLERIKRELTSHFVIESPCPPDLTLGVGRFDSSRAAPAGKIVAREEVQTRAYDSSFAGVSTRSFNERDWRPESARRIFKSSLASDFQVQGEVTHRPVIKVLCDRTVSQLSTSSLTPSTEPFHSHVAKI